VKWHNTVFARSGTYPCTNCILAAFDDAYSVTCLRLSDASVICWVTYFQFPTLSLLFFHISVTKQHQHCGVAISDIGRCRKFGRYVSCTERMYSPGERLWIDSNGKKGTRHRVEGQFGSEFPAICYHRGVMEAWSRKTWEFCEQFFFGKTTPYGNIFKIMFWKFAPFQRSTSLCSNVVKFVWQEIGEIVRYLSDQKKLHFGCLSNCRYCANRVQNLPGPASNNVLSAPDVIQIGSLSAELHRTRENGFFAP